MRQVRKEERKEERRQARRDRNAASDEQELDQETYLRAVGFDPDSMKVQRYTVMLLYFVSIFLNTIKCQAGDWENYVAIMGVCSFGEWGIASFG